MSDGEKRPGVRKSESPEVSQKSKVESPKLEEEDNSEIEHPTSEITELPTANSKLQTENMEVHHHPEVEKKGLKEYFFEGIMIFLAVMMGYLAESARDHLSDRAKEKDYLSALSAELKSDTAHYASSLRQVFYLRPLFDSLYNNARHPSLYKFTLIGKWNTPINEHAIMYWPALTIIQQLKSSGNLRLIDNEMIAQKIIEYETFIEGDYKEDLDGINKAYETLYSLEDAMCDYNDFNRQINRNMQLNPGKDIMSSSFIYDMPLVEKDPVKLNQLANSAVNCNSRDWGYMTRLNKAKSEAASLLKLIDNAYHFKNE
jgi:hypothetical protein